MNQSPSEHRKITLNYPPASSVWHLPVGIAQLAAVLVEDGHEVTQSYGHIRGLEHVLKQYGGGHAEGALDAIRDTRSDIYQLYQARKTLEEVSGSIPTQDAFSVQRNNISYVSEHYDGSIEGVMNAVQQRTDHLWYEYFRECEIAQALKFKPDLYGISIADERQFIQGFVLASMVKEALPETLVVMGGNFFSRITSASQHPEFARLFELCDAIVYREGFQPIQQLASTLDPSKVSGTVWRDGQNVRVNPATDHPTDFNSLPTPIFESTRQWSPDRVYPLYTMSNCPMQCGFCAISAGSDSHLEKPRSMTPQRIAEHMIALEGKRFDIQDETFPIPRQLELGEELKKRGYAATWNCYLTITDQLLSSDICQKLYEAGCRSVQLGLESLTSETLVNEHKGWNHPENYARILRNLKDSGIQTHVFIMSGIPGEPLHSSLKWLDFFEEQGDSVLTIKAGRYRLTRHSPEEKSGSHSQHIEVLPDVKPLHLNRDFRYRNQSRKQVEAIRDIHEQMSRRHWGYEVTSTLPWWANRGRFTWNELRQMAQELSKVTRIEQVPHLQAAVRKVAGIIKKEEGQEISFNSYEEILKYSRIL